MVDVSWIPDLDRPEASRITITPLRRGDISAVTEVFEALSPRSRLRRYLSPIPRLTSTMLAGLTDVDGTRQVAVAAREGRRCIGIARAVVQQSDPSVAELAVEVADEHQRMGTGRRLIDHVSAEAARIGVRELVASVQPDNRAAIALMRSIGASGWFEDGLVEFRWSLPPAACL
jgi:L-amino acid N-acyltransferase YncA